MKEDLKDFVRDKTAHQLSDLLDKISQTIESMNSLPHLAGQIATLCRLYQDLFQKVPLTLLLEKETLKKISEQIGKIKAKVAALKPPAALLSFLRKLLSFVFENLRSVLELKEKTESFLTPYKEEKSAEMALTENIVAEFFADEFYCQMLYFLEISGAHNFEKWHKKPFFFFSQDALFLIRQMIYASIKESRPILERLFYVTFPRIQTASDLKNFFSSGGGLDQKKLMRAQIIRLFTLWHQEKPTSAASEDAQENSDTLSAKLAEIFYLNKMRKKRGKKPTRKQKEKISGQRKKSADPTTHPQIQHFFSSFFEEKCKEGLFFCYENFGLSQVTEILSVSTQALAPLGDAFKRTIRQTNSENFNRMIESTIRKSLNLYGTLFTQIFLLGLFWNKDSGFNLFYLHETFLSHQRSLNPPILLEALNMFPINALASVEDLLQEPPLYQRLYLRYPTKKLLNIILAFYDRPFAPVLRQLYGSIDALSSSAPAKEKADFIKNLKKHLIDTRKTRTLSLQNGENSTILEIYESQSKKLDKIIIAYLKGLTIT